MQDVGDVIFSSVIALAVNLKRCQWDSRSTTDYMASSTCRFCSFFGPAARGRGHSDTSEHDACQHLSRRHERDACARALASDASTLKWIKQSGLSSGSLR